MQQPASARVNRHRWKSAALGAALALLAVACGSHSPPQDTNASPAHHRPNVIFIVIDALRADHMGTYGYERNTTPNLDRMARLGLVFDRAYSAASWTLPSLASYMTSVYPEVHGLRRPPGESDQFALPEEFVTLAESLKQNGFQTAAITSQPWFSESTGLIQGFDQARTVSHASAPGEARILTDALIAWLNEDRARPFFLYAHYMGPHSPYDVPSRFSGRYTADLEPSETIREFHDLYEFQNEVDAYRLITQRARDGGLSATDVEYLKAEYDEKLAFTDDCLGALFRHLDETGILEHSILIVTADHGEAFYEHGTVFHGQHLHEELVRVPLILHLPGDSRPPGRFDEIVELIDLYPTIHELIGVSTPPHVQGTSMTPVLDGGSSDGVAFSEYYGFKVTTRDWSSFYEYNDRLHVRSGFRIHELYDLRRDPLEQENVASSMTGAAERHRELAFRLWKQISETSRRYDFENEAAELDPQTIEALQSLGYLDDGS